MLLNVQSKIKIKGSLDKSPRKISTKKYYLDSIYRLKIWPKMVNRDKKSKDHSQINLATFLKTINYKLSFWRDRRILSNFLVFATDWF